MSVSTLPGAKQWFCMAFEMARDLKDVGEGRFLPKYVSADALEKAKRFLASASEEIWWRQLEIPPTNTSESAINYEIALKACQCMKKPFCGNGSYQMALLSIAKFVERIETIEHPTERWLSIADEAAEYFRILARITE